MGAYGQGTIVLDHDAEVAGSWVARPSGEVLGQPARQVHDLELDPRAAGIGQEEQRFDDLAEPCPLVEDAVEDLPVLLGVLSRRRASWTWPRSAVSGLQS